MVYTTTTEHERFDTYRGIIYTYDPVAERVRDHAWYLYGPNMPAGVTLGITPSRFLNPDAAAFLQAPQQPPGFIYSNVTTAMVAGKEGIEHIRLLGNFLYNEECCKSHRSTPKRAKSTSPATIVRTLSVEAPRGDHEAVVEKILQSYSPEEEVAVRSFKKLSSYINGIVGPQGSHPLHPHGRSGESCQVCAVLEMHKTTTAPTEHNCVNMCWDLIVRNLQRAHASISGVAVKYAATLLPLLNADERKRAVSLSAACLLRPNDLTEKAVRRVLYFLSKGVHQDSEATGLAILRELREHATQPLSSASRDFVKGQILDWANQEIISKEARAWHEVAALFGVEPLPRLLCEGDVAGASVFPNDKAFKHTDPSTIAAWNVNSFKARWSSTPFEPKAANQHKYMSALERRNLSLQGSVYCAGTPDVFFMLETKMTLVDMMRLPGILAWRKQARYDYLYSTWSSSPTKGGAGYGGVSAFCKTPPEKVLYTGNSFIHCMCISHTF